MAGITFQIGDTQFTELGSGSGRMAIDCDPGYAAPQTHKFHLPGTTGNLVIMSGTGTRTLRFQARYRATDVATLGSYLVADRDAWKDAEISCITDEGETVTRCIVKDMRRKGRIRATGRGVCSLDVEIVVESNAGV